MTTASVAVQIPQPLYHRLEQAAARLQKPVENLLVETLQAALPAVDEIPDYVQAEVAALDNLDETTLREIAESEMRLKISRRSNKCLICRAGDPFPMKRQANWSHSGQSMAASYCAKRERLLCWLNVVNPFLLSNLRCLLLLQSRLTN